MCWQLMKLRCLLLLLMLGPCLLLLPTTPQNCTPSRRTVQRRRAGQLPLLPPAHPLPQLQQARQPQQQLVVVVLGRGERPGLQPAVPAAPL